MLERGGVGEEGLSDMHFGISRKEVLVWTTALFEIGRVSFFFNDHSALFEIGP